ncbi:MAG: iron ABC transporter permease [Jaaginema sp. PMC 1079.18]|nr:iron ABC transporter permease [Jaaginema sp. PMC 1080.18]MEC4849367.1 iron ABC transporter permease [Jaaginema sp. PMC 1079.18]MEC4865400.1 iron ABC transporter permease [Jaaginema sp. PMC 1078.18]
MMSSAIALDLAIGDVAFSASEWGRALVGLGTPDTEYIIWILRLPRLLLAMGVGMSLAIAGTIAQAITRNPLASPSILGVNAGASLATVGLIVGWGQAPLVLFPLAALSGAGAIAVLLYLLVGQHPLSPRRLILAGVGCQLIASAATQGLLALGDLHNASQALVWLTGSVYGRSWPQVLLFWPGAIALSLLAVLKVRELDILSLDDDVALALGSSLSRQRLQLLGIAIALAALAVTVAGAIGFVGLIAPHLARRWVGPTHTHLLPTAALFGALLVILADTLGRCLFPAVELPCGLIIAPIGAPYLAYLLLSFNSKARSTNKIPSR